MVDPEDVERHGVENYTKQYEKAPLGR
jgi:hypothetical protein